MEEKLGKRREREKRDRIQFGIWFFNGDEFSGFAEWLIERQRSNKNEDSKERESRVRANGV